MKKYSLLIKLFSLAILFSFLGLQSRADDCEINQIFFPGGVIKYKKITLIHACCGSVEVCEYGNKMSSCLGEACWVNGELQ